MSKIDEKYIENLQAFTSALNEIVEMMKEQQKTDKSDVVNEALKNIPDNLHLIVENLKEINSRSKNIKTDTSNILKEVQDLKKSRETGMFGKIEDGNNKKKIVDGVKAVILIAGGVLAMGMAFKIVGKVDFTSVVALSAAMLMSALTVKKIYDIKGLTFKTAGMVVLTMIAISAGLFASALILKHFPAFGLLQGLSIFVVAASIGIATWVLMKAVGKVDLKKNWANILLLPVMLPLIALGIFLAGNILKDVQPFSLKQALSVAMLGVAIGVATFAISFALKGLKNVTWKELLTLPLTIPLIAGGVVLASIIFQAFVPLKNPLQLLLGSAVIGLSMLIFAPTVYILGKLGFGQMIVGAIALNFLALSMVGVAWIFQLLPDSMKYPSLKWSLSTGIGMLAFLPTLVAVGLIAATGVGALVVGLGLVALPLIALSMVAVSQILQLGSWDKHPSIGWSIAVGGSLIAFAAASILSAPAALLSGVMSFLTGEDPLVKIANSMVTVSWILQKGKWNTGYPTKDWAEGVGISLFMFASAYAVITAIEGFNSVLSFVTGKKSQSFNQFVISAAITMLTARDLLNIGDWKNAKYPSKDYAEGVGGFLLEMAKSYAIVTAIEGFNKIISFLGGGGGTGFNQFVTDAANTMITARDIISGSNWTGLQYPDKKYSEGVGGFLIAMAQAYKTFNSMGFFSLIGTLFGAKKVPLDVFVKDASNAIMFASKILAGGTYGNLPNKVYTQNFADFITKMGDVVNNYNVDISDLNSFVVGMRLLLPILSQIATTSQMPINDIFIQSLTKLRIQLNSLPDKSKQIRELAASFRELSESLRGVKTLENFKISYEIYGDDSDLLGKITKVFYNKPGNKEISKAPLNKAETKKKEDEKTEKFYQDVSSIRSMLSQLVDNMDTPQQTGNFYK